MKDFPLLLSDRDSWDSWWAQFEGGSEDDHSVLGPLDDLGLDDVGLSDPQGPDTFVFAMQSGTYAPPSPVSAGLTFDTPEMPSVSVPDFAPVHVGPPSGKGGKPAPQPVEVLFASYTSGEADTAQTDHFNIDIQFYGDWDAMFMDAFAAAADFLSSIMACGLRDDTAAFNTFDTGTLFTVDDVLIEARLPTIDGSGSVLGRAGAYSVRDPGTVDQLTTVVGVMEFDVADAADLLSAGTWDDVILHEMIHVLGLGSLWGFYDGLVTQTSTQIAGADTKRPNDDVFLTTAEYNGAAGNAEFNAEMGTTGEKIVVETDGGSGTALAHWNEEDYWGELMTGYLYSDFGTPNVADPVYLSDWSLAALADIGYDVDIASFGGADQQNALADGVDLETADPMMAFYDANGGILFA
ncbi:hypothetical protein ATO6_16810 [Oceanicola sp. 22II-s10i]|uniref:leishmanolysin-related zinc metalloendopeptidase n=1 Tax=Oceanicola sp. 22II-s10i TaxID=1317116 RepID=UPI000B527E24|nr:leishmanolysin-related zinc metalloendopeptidase [Oceanicola sp. 22II-s10i]OWU83543.1 hypothetical protein ATO6_16810 [Oceanicola sp. 22II-s10i]